MKSILTERLRLAFARDRVICRLLSAWLAFVALTMLKADADLFSGISFGQGTSLLELALVREQNNDKKRISDTKESLRSRVQIPKSRTGTVARLEKK